MTTNIVDHVARAIARLAQQFRGKPKTESLVEVLVTPVQELETALYALLTERGVDLAIGAQLDAIGKLVGQPRGGLVDDTYRRYVRARITANKSNGTVADLIRIAELVLDEDRITVTVTQQGPATVVVRAVGFWVTDVFALVVVAFLRSAVAAGVRLIFEYATTTDANILFFDEDTFDANYMITAIE